MSLRAARARLVGWWRPSLVVPFVPTPAPAAPGDSVLGEIRGYRRGGVMVIVSPRGTELPVSPLSGWLVVDVVRLVAQIERWPELAPGSRRV